MKKNNYLLLAFVFASFILSCKSPKHDLNNLLVTDTTFYKLDTTLNNVDIDGLKYSIKFFRDKYDEHLEQYGGEELYAPGFEQSPITLVISKNNVPMYLKKFDLEPNPYSWHNILKGQKQGLGNSGKLYLMISRNNGGSGSRSHWYYINGTDSTINLNKLFMCNEISYVVFNKNDNEILLLEGHWRGGEGETHFDNHRYAFKKYVFAENYFKEVEIGETEFKYPSPDDDGKNFQQVLIDIKTSEPILFESINVDDYKF
jgi:hypothetical protein